MSGHRGEKREWVSERKRADESRGDEKWAGGSDGGWE